MYKHITKLYALFVFGGIILYFLIYSFLDLFFIGFSDIKTNYSIADIIIVSMIFAPLFETFIFQYLILKLPFHFFKFKKTKSNILILCSMSSLFFGSQHYQNFGYMIFAFILGVYLSFAFVYAEYQSKYKINGYKLVVTIHFFINFTAFLLNHIL